MTKIELSRMHTIDVCVEARLPFIVDILFHLVREKEVDDDWLLELTPEKITHIYDQYFKAGFEELLDDVRKTPRNTAI